MSNKQIFIIRFTILIFKRNTETTIRKRKEEKKKEHVFHWENQNSRINDSFQIIRQIQRMVNKLIHPKKLNSDTVDITFDSVSCDGINI